MEPLKPKPSTISIGVDLGARVDPTAICVAEHVGGRYLVRLIERLPLGTPYSAVAARVGHLYCGLVSRLAAEQDRADYLNGGFMRAPYMNPPTEPRVRGRVAIYVDATGGGIPATEILRDHPDLAGATIVGVFITSGERCTVKAGVREGSVGKAHLVGRLQSLLQPPARIELPPGAEKEALIEELRDYEIHQNESDGRLTAGVFKIGKHDDLATALGLACLVSGGHFETGCISYID